MSKLDKNLQERVLSARNMPLSERGVGIFWFGGGIQELQKFEFISDSFEKKTKFRFFRVRGKLREIKNFEAEEKEDIHNIRRKRN